jgi:hypothetical protein
LLVVAAGRGAGADDAPIRLQIPLNCRLSQDCFVQNYFDHDPGNGAQDFNCGLETFDGLDGTDFRVPDLSNSRDLAVLAIASGRAIRSRDGVKDISVRKIGEAAVAGMECGNGMVIDHGGGWEAQYCHMAEGSLMVRPGDVVSARQPIGRVGMSGLSEFPHVHVTVRFRGRPIDPFAFGWQPGQCGSGEVLWNVPPGWSYQTDFVINAGFATDRVTIDDVNSGALERTPLALSSSALFAVVLAGGLTRGSTLVLTLVGPDGATLATKSVGPLAGPMAQFLIAIGKRRPATGWLPGVYQADCKIANGRLQTEKHIQVRL